MSEKPKITEVLHGLGEGDLLSSLITPSLELNYIPKQGMIIPTYFGQILQKEEFQEVVRAAMKFYGFYSSDAIGLVNDKAKTIKASDSSQVDFSVTRRPGYVLLIKSMDGMYRVGLCSNLAKRLKEFQVNKIYTVIHSYKCVDMRLEEFHWRRQFAAQRTEAKGAEWISLSDADIEAFSTHIPASKAEDSDLQDAKKVRLKNYWDALVEVVGKVADNQGGKEVAAMKALMAMVDRSEGWEDNHVFACLQHLKNDKKYQGIIGYNAVLTYMPSYMARRTKDAGTGASRDGENRETAAATSFSDNKLGHI